MLIKSCLPVTKQKITEGQIYQYKWIYQYKFASLGMGISKQCSFPVDKSEIACSFCLYMKETFVSSVKCTSMSESCILLPWIWILQTHRGERATFSVDEIAASHGEMIPNYNLLINAS